MNPNACILMSPSSACVVAFGSMTTMIILAVISFALKQYLFILETQQCNFNTFCRKNTIIPPDNFCSLCIFLFFCYWFVLFCQFAVWVALPAPQSESDHCQQPLHPSPSRPTYHHPLHLSYGGEKNVCIVFPNFLFTTLNLRFLVPNTRETDETCTRYNICRLRNCSYHHYLGHFIVPTFGISMKCKKILGTRAQNVMPTVSWNIFLAGEETLKLLQLSSE